MKQVVIQGIAGCYHEVAARQYFQEEGVDIVPCESFSKEFRMLAADDSLLGIVAIENTIAGPLLQNHELLSESNMQIIGEQKIRIEHMVAAHPDDEIEDIREVNSHPIALMQCQNWFQRHPSIKVVERGDTASSAYEIMKSGLRGHAAICGELAANLYGLKILDRGVETNKRNFTRFLILASEDKAPSLVDKDKINKASIVFTLAHTSGALSKVLTILSFYDLNLSKIQSMPIIGVEWEYKFYVDLTFSSFERYIQAIEAIRPLTNYIKSLGEYVRCENPK
ncbi:MAG: prephenate dehydratase domain-containing protein [Rikenellaceae bacterium]